LTFILYVTWEWLTVGNYLVELCQDGTRDPIGCTLIEYRSGVLPLCRTFTDTSFAKLVRELWARSTSRRRTKDWN